MNRRLGIYCYNKRDWEDDDILIKPNGDIYIKDKTDENFIYAPAHRVGMTVNVKLHNGEKIRAFENTRYKEYTLMEIYGIEVDDKIFIHDRWYLVTHWARSSGVTREETIKVKYSD